MRAILALALLATLGFALAGCGMTKDRRVKASVTVTGTTTLSNVKTGTVIRCNGGPGAEVPPLGDSVGTAALHEVGTSGPSTELQLTHLPNGSVTVSCKP